MYSYEGWLGVGWIIQVLLEGKVCTEDWPSIFQGNFHLYIYISSIFQGNWAQQRPVFRGCAGARWGHSSVISYFLERKSSKNCLLGLFPKHGYPGTRLGGGSRALNWLNHMCIIHFYVHFRQNLLKNGCSLKRTQWLGGVPCQGKVLNFFLGFSKGWGKKWPFFSINLLLRLF